MSPTHTPVPVATAAETSAPTAAPVAQGWACPLPVTAAWGGAGRGDPDLPLWSNGGYHVQHYDLALDVDIAGRRLAGQAVLLARTVEPLDAFNLDFAGMEIARLTVDGAPARYCMDDAGELTVIPASPLAASQAFTISVEYTGSTRLREIARGQVGWANRDGAFFVMTGTGGPAFLYPSNEYGSEKATYTLKITVPKPYSAIAIGRPMSTDANERTTTSVWEMRTPHQYTMISVDKFPFSKDLAGPNGLPIRLDLPESVDAENAAVLEIAPAVVEYFSSLFGPYPYDWLGINWARGWPDQGVEGGTRVWLHVGTSRSELRERLVHEIAHQWIGSSIYGVTVHDWPLFEGLATYAQVLWREHQGESVPSIISMQYLFLPSQTIPPGLATLADFEAGGPVFYDRPALAFHALRLRVGDDKFFAILRSFYVRYQMGEATLDDFFRTAEEVSGQELDDLVQAWFYREAVPDIPELNLSKPK